MNYSITAASNYTTYTNVTVNGVTAPYTSFVGNGLSVWPPIYKRPRDSQRTALYKAEDVVFRDSIWARPAASTAEAQAWLDQILVQRWFLSRWGFRQIKIVGGNGNSATYGGSIRLCAMGRSPWIILHELSHVLASHQGVAAHGPEYAATYLTLVDHALGEDWGRDLRKAFTTGKRKVRYRKGFAAVPNPTA